MTWRRRRIAARRWRVWRLPARRRYAAWRRKADRLLVEWQRAIDTANDAAAAYREQRTPETADALEVALAVDAITASAVDHHYKHVPPNPDDPRR